mmetsp:Transcript_13200/g.38030  ORF Transcript_13200/g.38030 Transcript_13200/m.38030 type:complete len:318 (+) Transcript_13200:280-1233(+)
MGASAIVLSESSSSEFSSYRWMCGAFSKLQRACAATAPDAVYIVVCAQGCGSRILSCMARRRTEIIMMHNMGTKAKACWTWHRTDKAHLRARPGIALHTSRQRTTTKNTTVKNMTQLMAAEMGFDAASIAEAPLRWPATRKTWCKSHMSPVCVSSIANTLSKMTVVPTYIVQRTKPQAIVHTVAAAGPCSPLWHQRSSLASPSASSRRKTSESDGSSAADADTSAIAAPPAHRTWPPTDATVAYIAAAAKESGSKDNCTARSSMPTNKTQIMTGNCKASDSATERSDANTWKCRRLPLLRRVEATMPHTSSTACSAM